MKFNLGSRGQNTWSEIKWWWFIRLIHRYTEKTIPNYQVGGDDIPEWKDMKSHNIDIEFKINGVELDFEEALKIFEETFQFMVKKKARKLIKEKLGTRVWEFADKIQDFENEMGKILKDKIQELKNDLGVENKYE